MTTAKLIISSLLVAVGGTRAVKVRRTTLIVPHHQVGLLTANITLMGQRLTMSSRVLN